jgi:hypothetical protein
MKMCSLLAPVCDVPQFCHFHVNHTLSHMKPDERNPFVDGDESTTA